MTGRIGKALYFGPAGEVAGRWYGPDVFVPTVWPCARCGSDVRGTDWACHLCSYGALKQPGQDACDHLIVCGACWLDPARRFEQASAEGYQPSLFEAVA